MSARCVLPRRTEAGTTGVPPRSLLSRRIAMRLIGVVLGITLALGVAMTATAEDRGTSPSLLARLWPASVKFPAGMKLYKPTEYAQRSVNSNNAPLLEPHHLLRDDVLFGRNPNRAFPYAAPGGLHAAQGWTSVVGIMIPEGQPVRTWHEYYGSFPRPYVRWQFPVGTVVADILVNEINGKPFELRTLRKTETGWVGRTPWQDDHLPHGYQRTDRKCVECHKDAGDAHRYGLGVRGNDFVFSWTPFAEGTVLLRRDLIEAGIVQR